MPIHITICDDSQEDISRLSGALRAYDPAFAITSFTDSRTLLDELADTRFTADILFLDIYMPGLDGIETARKIRAQRPDVKIIFVSTSREHYPQAYEVFAFNYLVKPFAKEQLDRILARAIRESNLENGHKIRFSYKSALHTVDCRDILYLESSDKRILFHLADGGTLQRYGKLDDMVGELPEQAFIRCHQSFVVNTAHIRELGESYFRVGQALIGISKKHAKFAKEQYYAYLFSHMDRGAPE
ncbi:two component transcriptional regulator, LytTR family [Syntrophobotulus glycolicus DSM 8271]|uniref:Stage 0 sporulation protein A homolog n=1 Tax=Syntrophobotulus glycolicus (strain DSM 8271 / FlGlyR) TaxID=645991 RepID=F0T1W3_SYNGF|nr:LytTR family DNA-binding domain-containing protein [Syntrophobotulus glycolicus]ADY55227.1 two component transcriptional regulator, LytTR family [Syntrophobotulus glycolicus DSM 8271]